MSEHLVQTLTASPLALTQELLFWQKEQRSNVDTSECKNTSVFTASSTVYFSASCLCPWVTVLLSRATLNSAVRPVTSSHYKTEPGLLGDTKASVLLFHPTWKTKTYIALPCKKNKNVPCNAHYLAALCSLCWARALGVVLHGNQQKCRWENLINTMETGVSVTLENSTLADSSQFYRGHFCNKNDVKKWMNNSRGRPQDVHSHSCQRRRLYYSSEKGNILGRNCANWKIVK